MDKQLIRRSPKGRNAQIISMGILALILALFTSWVLGRIFGWTSNDGSTIKVLSWIVIIGGWAITSIKLWSDWRIRRYEITPEALIVHAKAGGWGSTQTIYRYESIISLRMTQGFWGKKYNFGDVYISIPKIDHEIVMNDIDNPLAQLEEIQKRMNERSVGSHSLIN